MFFSVITKNLIWEVLTKNFVTFKRWDGLRMKNFNIMGVRWKIRFLRGFTKKQYIGGLPKKAGGLGQFVDLIGSLAKKKESSAFEGFDTPMHIMDVEGIQTQRWHKVAANNRKFIKYLHSNIKWQLQM